MNKKIKILFIITFVFTVCSVLCNRVYAIDTNADNGDGTAPGTGNYYSVDYLKIKISIVDSDNKFVGYNSKIYQLYGDPYTSFFPQWFRNAAASNKYKTESCFGDVSSQDCKYSDFLNIIVDHSNAEDREQKKEAEDFIIKIAEDLSNNGTVDKAALSKYYLMFEPYYTINISGTAKEGITRKIISDFIGDNSYEDPYNKIPGFFVGDVKQTFYNFIISIYSVEKDNFGDLPFYSATYTNGACNDGDTNKCLNYYYKTLNSGLGVGYLKISEIICDSCECKFEEAKGTMVGRIELYKSLDNKALRNILDMNITDASTACRARSVVINEGVSCLSANVGAQDFSATNLSNYTSTIDFNGVTGYCNDSLQFNKKIFSDEYHKLDSKMYFGKDGTKIKSGQMILQRNINETSLIGVEKLTRTCYAYGAEVTPDVKINSESFEARLTRGDSNSEIKKGNEVDFLNRSYNEGLNTFVATTIVSYNMNPVYAKIASGETSNEACSDCKFLGYGLISKLNEQEGEHEFSFIIKYNPGETEALRTRSVSCYYDIKVKGSDLIKKLKFRIIDILNSFPGKSGGGRKVGFNWCDGNNCIVDNNSIIKKFITDANNSFNVKSQTPLYKITLNSSDIRKIRDFNKNHKYNDFTLICVEGKNCQSQFLKDYVEN